MSFGMLLENADGRTLIDEASRQVQFVKTGDIYPYSIGKISSTYNPFREGSTSASPIIVPGGSRKSIVIVRPKKVSGTYDYSTAQFAVETGTVDITWTSSSAVPVGQNYVLATFSKSSASADNTNSHPGITVNTTTVNDDPTVDSVGGIVGSYGSGWSGYGFSTSGHPFITKIETTSTSGVYKLTMSGNCTSAMPANTTAIAIEREVFWFHGRNSEKWAYGSPGGELTNWNLEYKMGFITDTAEESGQYGLEIFNSAGEAVWNSNRENYQIESITQGYPDLQAGSSLGEWAVGSARTYGNPVFFANAKYPADYDNYWAMVAATGKTAAFVGAGFVRSGNNPYSFEFACGFTFQGATSSAYYGFFDNASLAEDAGGGSSGSYGVNTESNTSNERGWSMSPMMRSKRYIAPAVSSNQSGVAYVHDTWAYEAERQIIVGRLI